MITLSVDELQKLLYRAKTDAVEKYRSVYRSGNNTTWIDSAQFYSALDLDATHMASNAQCSPLDIDRIVSVL